MINNVNTIQNTNDNNNNPNPVTPTTPDKIVIPTTTPRDREELSEGIKNPK
jgi:hypothetical protein